MVDVTLPVVITTALVDSINPCAIGVLVLLLATLVSLSKNKMRMITIGFIYVGTVYVTYLAAGLGLLYFVYSFGLASWITPLVAVLVIILGLIEFRDAFTDKASILAIPKKYVPIVQERIQQVSIPGSIVLGVLVAAVELPCTGGPYLAITTLLATEGFTLGVFGLLALYNFIFVLPLLIIIGVVAFGVSSKTVESWKNDHKKLMRIASGLVMIGLGILLFIW